VTTKTATQARADLYRLLDQVAKTHEPVAITGRRHNGVLISEEDWRAVQETLTIGQAGTTTRELTISLDGPLASPIVVTAEMPGLLPIPGLSSFTLSSEAIAFRERFRPATEGS